MSEIKTKKALTKRGAKTNSMQYLIPVGLFILFFIAVVFFRDISKEPSAFYSFDIVKYQQVLQPVEKVIITQEVDGIEEEQITFNYEDRAFQQILEKVSIVAKVETGKMPVLSREDWNLRYKLEFFCEEQLVTAAVYYPYEKGMFYMYRDFGDNPDPKFDIYIIKVEMDEEFNHLLASLTLRE